MNIDLLHNKIIKETLTEGFEKSVYDNLVPKLCAHYGQSLEGVQLYEDYINDDFIKDGYWYYPLTVVIGGIHAVVWIKWDISVSENFKDGNPYAYVGEGEIDFLIADDVPIAFKNSIEGRSNYFEGGYVKLNVVTDAPNPRILAGKYSQTFVDEMNRQLSLAISRACGVKGLEESSIELDMFFAPNTYMEHTSENVTYRRLLISAKGCSVRDFWIKWTRKNSSVAYSVNDNVSSEDIVFELGEDVSQKIREKEYRFLVYGNSDKYRVAMGRKNVTEWRELIKRAVKRGELFKTTGELEENAHVAEVSDKLSEILEKCGVAIPTTTSSDIRVDAQAANEALRMVVLGNGKSEGEDYVPEIPAVSQPVSEVADVAEVIENSELAAEKISPATEEPTFIADELVLEADKAEEIYDEELSVPKEPKAEDSVFNDITDDENGEFSFGKSDGIFDVSEEGGEELSFEDILEEFIPKNDVPEEEDEIPSIESVDISDIDESESVRFDISKTDDDAFDIYEASAADNELPELEVEIYEEGGAEDTLEKSEDFVEEELTVSEPETEDAVSSYDELAEIENVTAVTEETFESVGDVDKFDSDMLVRLENEISSLKHQLELERIAKESAEASLEELMLEKSDAVSEIAAQNEKITALEDELSSLRASKENAKSQLELELLAAADLRVQNEKQKFAIEQVKKLVEEETAARESAELQLEELRIVVEELKKEKTELEEAARISEEACRVAEEMCKQHERELLNQIELTEKERVREKNLFAEAARQAKEENEQRFAEMKEAELARIAEEARIEALRQAEEQRLRLLDPIGVDNESLEGSDDLVTTEKENRKKALEDRAREARLRMEERARINAEAKASAWGNCNPAPVCENPATPVVNDASVIEDNEPIVQSAPEVVVPEIENQVLEEPVLEPTPAPVVNYTYKSYIVRLMFRQSADPNVTARIHEMISYALTEFGKDNIYMKVKASTPDNYTVILNFVKFPEEEFNLLVDLINYLGKSDLGIYKVVLD